MVDLDNSLLQRAALTGDPAALEELFDMYYEPVYQFSFRLCGEKALAEDIAQDTFVKVARSIKTYSQKFAFKTWLFSIALNIWRDMMRSRTRFHKALAELDPLSNSNTNYTEDHSAIILECLAQLSAKQREVLVLVYFEDMTHDQAAKVIGCAIGTLSWRIFSAKRKMKELLLTHGVDFR